MTIKMDFERVNSTRFWVDALRSWRSTELDSMATIQFQASLCSGSMAASKTWSSQSAHMWCKTRMFALYSHQPWSLTTSHARPPRWIICKRLLSYFIGSKKYHHISPPSTTIPCPCRWVALGSGSEADSLDDEDDLRNGLVDSFAKGDTWGQKVNRLFGCWWF